MLQAQPLLIPIFFMAGLSSLISFTLLVTRVRLFFSKDNHPDRIAFEDRVSKNYKNLYEIPLLFYVVCLLAIALNSGTPKMVVLASIYVALRCVHSLIHCFWDNILFRMPVFVASMMTLLALWGHLGMQIIS